MTVTLTVPGLAPPRCEALRIGTIVSATPSEASSDSEIVSAWSRMSWPARPSTNTSGRNTATAVRVEAATAIATVRAPWRAASRAGRPSSRFRNTLSSTTIESSTTRPTASASPPSDMTLKDSPKRYMMMKVASTDTGSETAMIRVERTSRRNAKMTRIASSPPIQAESTTSLIELSMKRD